MSKCVLCKRYVMGKKRFGLCPVCFANICDVIAILLLPVVATVYVLLPIDILPEILLGPIAFLDDILIAIGCAICMFVLVLRIKTRLTGK
ncbi:hypothetical protein SAMN02910456_02591 [Ruminococcaceae bacterium YRB3002]|nr:hypothetical protein SAMN02910456_02591 [Ruminococcaceae bacterium YRB3002]